MSMLTMAILLLALAAFAIMATEFGVDSREGSDDPRRSEYPIAIS